jgi:uncharacterized phage-associated protein
MSIRFREDRATQAAALLLRLRGHPMSYLKLLKLLYLADRQALLSLGRPITHDRFVSMQYGPVLSHTLDLISTEPEPDAWSYWHTYISAPRDWEVSLLTDAPVDQLSRAEEGILHQVFDKFGHWGRWELVDYTHSLPEYEDSHGSSIPIPIHRLLVAGGKTEDDAAAIVRALEAEEDMSQLLE